jgi:rhodanese-related sulfurtransferase
MTIVQPSLKTMQSMLAAAQANVPQIDIVEARARHGRALFVDVRDQHEVAAGYIPGALHIPRGHLEFIADPASPSHPSQLAVDAELVIYCAAGGRSALAAATLREMGYANVSNLVGGYAAWVNTGGPIEGD